MRIVLVSPPLSQNAAGRAQCLYSILTACTEVDSVDVLQTGDASDIWPPIRGSEFSRSARAVPSWSSAKRALDKISTHGRPDVVWCVKPQATTLGLATRLTSRLGSRLIVDIDDDDLAQERTSHGILGVLGVGRPREAGAARHPLPRRWSRTVVASQTNPRRSVSVSNPALQRRYGGTLVPHVRELPDLPLDPVHIRASSLSVAFVGTVRPHKGVAILRRAVEDLRATGYAARLTVTDDPPQNAKPWESWVGVITREEARDIYLRSSVLVVPSPDGHHARHQFPVKLLDALAYGLPVAASDLPVHRWVGGGLFDYALPGSASELAKQILVASHRYGPEYTVQARHALRQRFTPRAVAAELTHWLTS